MDGLEGASIAEQVRARMDLLTASERRAAHVLLAGYPIPGLETVAEFAKRAKVSPPTILRFVNRLGYAGYPDFQRELRTELEAQQASPLAKAVDRDAGQAVDKRVAQFRDAVAANVAETFNRLAPAEFEAVVGLLAAPNRRLYLIGGRFTDPVAAYCTAHLRVVRSRVDHLQGQANVWRDYLLDMGRSDVLVVFDVRRYQEDLLELARKAQSRGATVVLLTDQWLSPVIRHARHVLAARIEAPSRWDSNAALLALVEALVAAVTDRIWPDAVKRIELAEKLRQL